jgi:hypothetical protein
LAQAGLNCVRLIYRYWRRSGHRVAKARERFARYPKAAYMTEIESWRELPDDRVEFTMRRLPSAD